MITLVQKAVRYAVGGSKSDGYRETVSCRPKLEEFVATSHFEPETKDFQGLVTCVDSSCIIIDQDVYCEASMFPPDKRVSIGVKVKGSAQRGGKHEMWRAKKIELVQEEWDTGYYIRGKDKGDGITDPTATANSNSEAISCKDLAEGIPGIFKSDVLSSVSPRSSQSGHMTKSGELILKSGVPATIIGKVTGIFGDTVTLNDNTYFDITRASCNMVLVKGDWIVCELDGSSSVDDDASQLSGMIVVSSVRPLRKKRVRGEVTHSYQSHFIINEEIFCSRTTQGGNFAKVKDVVTVEVMESEQGKMCWRAITLASPTTPPSTQELGPHPAVAQLVSLPEADAGESRMKKLLENKGDITISQSISFPPVVLGHVAFTSVTIKNTGLTPRTLRRVYFVSVCQESQFSMISCSPEGVVDGSPRTMDPGAVVVVKLCCAGTLIGSLQQLCIFEFEGFQIGRHVNANVEDPLMASLSPVTSFTSRPPSHPLTMPEVKDIIVGQRSFKPSPFIPLKLPAVRVPGNLWHEVTRGDLYNVATVLREPLTADNYKEKFSLLLHLEEIKMTQQMRQFDMARVSFTPCGEYLSLSVPGLAEKRPSLLIGDTVIATDLCNPREVEYEGCIHVVLSTQILLKFHSSFHTSYHGEDYKVRFNFNRTPLRRCHFALDYTMKQLGSDVLFPSRLRLQLPQVCYIDPEVQKLTMKWKNFPSRSHQPSPEVKETNKLADALESGQDSSSLKLPVVTRLFGIPPHELTSHKCKSKNDIRGPYNLDKDALVLKKVGNGMLNDDSKEKLPGKLGGDASKSKSYYVIPVLPLSSTGTKTQGMQKLPTLNWFNETLNQEQKLAVRRILEGTTRPLPYIIFGPPGTGKTVTLVEAALQILTMIGHSRLLIVTPSNSASDLVTERLIDLGRLGTSDMVRLIAYQRIKECIPEALLPYCCNGDELEVRVHQRVIVTTATCAGVLYMQGLQKGHFSHVLIDEAGQLTEPECLVPLGLLSKTTGQIVLAGDPMQLGPVIQSDLAKQGGLQQSLLQRLCLSVLYQAQEMEESSAWVYEPSLVTQLVKNYRSHPYILAVPSRLFYRNTLQACANIEAQKHLLLWKELPNKCCPVLFHGVVGTNLQEGDSPSWFNPTEAFQVVRYTKSLLLHGVEERNIGLIAPYRKQIEKIHKLLTTFGIEDVKVGSVEEFQGQERNVILISTVRSSEVWVEEDAKYSLGFIKCCKRFNVAITRAQGLLVVVGNPFLLSMDDSWKELIKFCVEKHSYLGPEIQNLG